MAVLYARLIELGLIIFIGSVILLIDKIKSDIKFKKSEKKWIENSFEYNGMRFHKQYFEVVNGKITHSL